ncbi:MAG: TraB/GumN family protein [Chitinophagales bacterium]|nr:TraB/GumN family protein [Chitinophagales bacterium]
MKKLSHCKFKVCKFQSILSLFSLYLLIGSCCVAQGNSLLWEISGNGIHSPSYLYGTMHSRDNRVFHLADSVMIKFEKCEAFAMEVVIDNALQGKVMDAILMDSSHSLIRLLNEAQFDSVDAYCKKNFGYSISFFNKVKPIYTAVLLSQAESEDNDSLHAKKLLFLDQYLQTMAMHQHKKIYGLETAEEQLLIFDALSYKDQACILMQTIRKTGSDVSEYEEMMKYYTGNNLVKMMEFENDFSLPDTLFNALFTRRNHRMCEHIDSIIKSFSTFIAVGAGHLGGEKGLVSLLREKGFTVIPVIPSYKNYLETGWYQFTSPQNLFTIQFPEPPELTVDRRDSLDLFLYTSPIAVTEKSNLYSVYIINYTNIKPDSEKFFFENPSALFPDETVIPGHVEKILWNDWPARSTTYVMKGGKMITVLAIQMKNKLVILKAEDTKKITRLNRERFYNSFKLVS